MDPFIKLNKQLAISHNITNDKLSIYLLINLNGHNIKSLIDTGAQSTLISLGLVRKLGIENYIDKNCKIRMGGLDKTSIKCKKIHFMKIKVENDEYPINFYVLDKCVNDLVIGLNFLIKNNGIIDIKNKKIKLNDKEYQLIFEY
jgi:DNA damage-inducible protein 1